MARSQMRSDASLTEARKLSSRLSYRVAIVREVRDLIEQSLNGIALAAEPCGEGGEFFRFGINLIFPRAPRLRSMSRKASLS